MDPGGTYCLPQDPDFWEAMQNQYKDKTAMLLAKEKELRQKIADMELMLANNEKRGHPFRSSSPSNTVPKVFPQMSDCIVENVPKIIRDTSPVSSVLPQIPQSAMISSLTKKDHYPTNFFQKVMENAKSILTMRCNVVQPTNPIDEKPTKDPDLKCKCAVGDPQRLSNKADFGGSSTCDEATKTDATTDNCSQEVSTSYSCSLSSCKNMQYTQSADTMTDTKKDNSSFINSCTCGATNLISSAPAGRDVSDSVCQCCNPECGKEKDKDQNTDAPTVSARKTSCQCQHSSRSKSKKTGSGDSSKKRCNNETCPVIASRSAPDMAGNKPDVDLAQNKNGIKINENNEFPSPEYPVNTPNATVVPGRESSKDNSCPCSLKTITDLAAKEKQIKSQIQELQQREKSYDNLMDSFRNMASKTTCTCCTIIQGPNGDFDKISKELKVENKLLRSELEEMKMELKHCLEKIQGPMKQKLEAEKSKCVVLEGELNKAAQNMVINHDTHTREMNSLKLQLCTACNNISELNSMNRRLKDEMDSLDCMCAKLEEDLMKQKINEAETIKRLTRRRPEFEETNGGRAIQGGFRCDSNLDVIARKLSSTLKESEPCDQCAKLPPELTSAARCIRDLTDMVQQRKKEVEAVMGKTRDSYSQSPRTEDVGIQCKCLDEDTKATKTLYDVPSSFPEKDSSQYGQIGTKATSAVNTPSGVGSAYYSAEGEPLEPREEVKEETIIARQAYTVGPEQPEVATVATGASQQMPRAPVKLDDDDVCKEPCGDTAPCSKGKPCFELITSGILETEAAPAMAVKDEPTREMQIKTEEVKGEYQSSSMSKPSEEVSAIPLDIESQASKIGAEGGVESETASKGSRIPSAIAGDGTAGTGAAESSLGAPSQISGAPGEEAQGVVSKGVSPFAISGRIGAEGEISVMGTPVADGAIAKDISEGGIEVAARSAIDGPLATSAIAEGLGGGTIPPDLGGQIGVQGSVALGAPSTSPEYGAVAGATGGIPFKEERTGNFPFEVETRAEFLQEPPPDLQVTTTITASGTLEVITEAAGGVIETTLTYKEDGTLEVLTQLTEETKTRPAAIDYATPEISKAMKVPEEVVMGIQESIISGGETDLSGGLGTVSERSRDTTIISSVSEIDKTSAMAGTGKIYDTGETETIEKQEISEETEIPSSPVDETEEIPAEEVEEIEVAEEVEAAPIEEIETPAEEVEIPVEEVETDAAVEADEEVEEEAVEAEGILFEETVEEVAEEVEASPEEEAAEEAPEEEVVEEAPEEEEVVEVAPEEEAVEEAPEVDAAEEEAAPVEEGEMVEEAVEESPEEDEAAEEAVVESPEEGEPKPRGKDVCLCPDKPTEGEEPEPKEEVVKEEADEGEAIEEPAEEVAQETVEEAAEQMAEEATKETVEEPAEEMVEEPAEEATEEATEETAGEEVKIAEEESTPEPAEEGEPKRIGRDVCICPNRPTEGGEPEPKEEDELVEPPEGEPTEEGDEGEKAIAEGEPTSEPTEEGEAAVEGETMLEGTGEEDEAAEPAEGEEETAEPAEGEAVTEDKAVEETVPNEEDIDECHKLVEDIVSVAAKEGEEEAVAVSQKRDYSCQSTAAVEQSCQCCECKNVGVSTTQDSETATEEIMVQSEQTSQIETIKEEAEAEADPDLLTGGDTGDIAEAVSLEAGKLQGTTDEVSTINEEDTTDAPDVKASTPSADGDASEYTTAQEKSECTAPCAVSEVAVIEPPVEVITQEESECTAPCAVSEVAVVEPPAEVIIQEKSEAAVLEPPIEVKVQTPLAPVPKPSDIKEVKMKASVPRSSHIRGKCSTFITEESLEPCQDAAIQCDCAGEIEIDDHSEGRVSSGSDTEQESVKGKVSKLEAVKKMGSSEVPESVSKLSAGTSKTPSLGSTSSRKPRKKRSSRLENIRCDCPGVCQCVVCAPEVIAKRKALTGSPLPPTGQAGKLCCCLPQPQPQMQAFQNMSQPPIQMNQAYVQSQMPDPAYPHPLGCACAVCICSCTPGPRFGNTRTTIDDVFGRQVNAPLNYQHPPNYGLNSHPPNCECIDCLCMPTIKQLANLREMPVIKDEKQVYQVKCVCPKKPSKIPIPTNSPLGPPKAKTTIECTCEKCACTPCLSKQAGSQDEKPPGSELASLCDCKDCQCTVCFNKPPKKDDKPSSKGCCCKGDCTCDSCPIDKLKTAAEAAAPKRGPGHPEDCDCLECTCPRSPAMIGSGQSAAPAPAPTAKKQPPAGCDCVECACPGMAGDDLPVPPGCDCSVCVCPGRETAVGDSKRNIAECDCNPCECNPCADPKRRPEDLTMSPCDCPECKCEPCADPSKSGTKGGTKGHPATCDCPECVCEGQRCLQTDIGVGSKENKATHTPDCICEECLCDTEQHETGCTCPECQCVDCIYKKENKQISASECQCGDCTCIDCPKKQNTPQKQGDGQGGCTCSVCECTDCIYKKDQASKDCKCGDCKCIDCPKKHKDDAGAHGDDCTCTDCFLKKTNPADEECKCGDCLCVDCPKKHSGGDDSKKGAVGSGPCSCIVCACDVCSDPNKKKSGGGGGASKDGGCSCGDCKCVDCIHKKSDGKKQDAGKDCTCDTCQCTDCTGKKGSGGDGGKDGCTCGDCKCVDCIHKKSSGGQKQDTPAGGKEVGKGCTCATCLCVDCAGKKFGGGGGGGSGSSGGAGGASSGGDGGKTAGCTCKDCKCPDCIYKKSGDKKSGGAVFTDPPPFTVPIKEPCKCAKCECIVCASKGGGSAGGGSSGDQCTCDRPKFSKEGGTAKGGSSDGSPPPFQELVRQPCTCQKCDCVSCQKGGGSKSSGEGSKSSGGGATVDPPRFQELVREQCTCKKCDCVSCNKGGGSAQSGGDAKSDQCTCKKCVCSPCTKKGGSSEKGGSSAEAPPFEVPIRQPCKCTKCDCVSCNKSYVPSKSAAASATVMQCDCATCTCADEILKGKPLSNKTSKANAGDGCTCPNCVCDDCPKDQGHKTKSSKGKEVNISRSSKHEKGDLKTRSSNHICPSKDSIQNVSRMGNVELMAKIKRDTKANCECREQIKELKRALDKIKCACTEAEVKASKNKPFVKQASAFGQTMSGLKVALANLQEKCKAKDKMIEVMTDELKLRTSSNTVHKVMNTKRCADALDYDKAEDVQTVDSVSTNVLYAVGEEREIGHTKVRPKSSDCNASCKGVETEKTRKGKKKLKSHKGRETNIDLAGFEVVDIRRITQDSIIIKWKPPKSSLVTGYDIFINGVNKSKVMSGGRTSAMIHSLDLSATIQITIYAVTKCGRCEPPAIAIYEINC